MCLIVWRIRRQTSPIVIRNDENDGPAPPRPAFSWRLARTPRGTHTRARASPTDAIEHDEAPKRRCDESGDVSGTTLSRRSRPTSRGFNDAGGFSDERDDDDDDDDSGRGRCRWRRERGACERRDHRTVHASGQGAAAPCRGHSRLEYGGAPARLEQMELEASRVEEQGARYFVSVSDVKRHGFLVQAVSDGAQTRVVVRQSRNARNAERER